MKKSGLYRTFGRTLEQVFIGGPWTTTVAIIVVVQAVVHIVQLASTGEVHPESADVVYQSLAARLDLWREPWRFLTYVAVSYPASPIGTFQLALNLFCFGIVAGDVAQQMGPRRFLTYTLTCIVGAGVAGALFNPHVMVFGAAGLTAGMVMAFGFLNPARRIYGRVPARAYAVVLLGLLIGGHWLVFDHLESDPLVPDWWTFIAQSVGAMCAGYVVFVLRPLVHRHRIVRSMYSDLRSFQEEDAIRERVDILLAKISDQSYDSLTREERRFLKRASERLSHDEERRDGERGRGRTESKNLF